MDSQELQELFEVRSHPEDATMEVRTGEIGQLARIYMDVQKARMALASQIRDIEERYSVEMLCRYVDVAVITTQAAALKKAEAKIEKELGMWVRYHFMAPWVKETQGMGVIGFAKLLGVTGSLDLFPTVSKLWKFVGMAVMPDGCAPRRKRGVQFQAGWPVGVPRTAKRPLGGWGALATGGTAYAPQGRVVCFQIGEVLVKQNAQTIVYQSGPQAGKTVHRTASPYRLLYDQKKAQYLSNSGDHVRRGESDCPFGQVHRNKNGTIVGCGDKHAHNAAQRYAVKMLLKDLWVEWYRRRPTGR